MLDQLRNNNTWETYCDRYVGVDDRVMLAALCSSAGVPFETAWARYPLKKRLFESRVHVLSDDVVAMLRRVGASHRLAVVTSSARSEVEPILAQSGVLPLLHTVVYGGDVQRLKPAPDPYLLAAERLGVSRALVVEDSPAGVASGKAAGFDVLTISRQADVAALVGSALQPR
jgi:HAD superfamily hydrolase (TIGR01509 family)